MNTATPSHLEHLRAALVAQLEALRAELRVLHAARGDAAAAPLHEVGDLKDVARLAGDSGLDEAVEARVVREAEAAEAALQRLEQGLYGDCEDCGQAIAWRRLQVQPAARRCAQCQEVFEHRQALHGRPR